MQDAHRPSLQAVTAITVMTVADFPSGMVCVGAEPRGRTGSGRTCDEHAADVGAMA
jgi:hypothetical protein